MFISLAFRSHSSSGFGPGSGFGLCQSLKCYQLLVPPSVCGDLYFLVYPVLLLLCLLVPGRDPHCVAGLHPELYNVLI